MKICLDSSAFAKRFLDEPGSEEVQRLCSIASELVLSVICVPEIVSALNRRKREGRLRESDYTKIMERLEQETGDATVINLTPDLLAATIGILEQTPVRAMDAIHIACALLSGADLFVSGDTRQLAATQSLHINTLFVGTD